MAVVVGKNDELLFFLEESAIGELNSYDQFQEPLAYTFIYNLHDSSLHESLFHFNMQCNKLNEKDGSGVGQRVYPVEYSSMTGNTVPHILNSFIPLMAEMTTSPRIRQWQ